MLNKSFFTLLLLTVASSAHASPKPKTLAGCMNTAQQLVSKYLNLETANPSGPGKSTLRLTGSAEGVNGLKQRIYTYLFKVSGSKAVTRLVTDTNCKMMSEGTYSSLDAMNSSDLEDAQGGVSYQ